MTTTIQFRRGTAAQWTSANTLLAQGELGLELDTGKFKVGDGLTYWNNLSYSSGQVGPQGAQGAAGISGTQGAQGARGFQGVAGGLGPQGISGNQFGNILANDAKLGIGIYFPKKVSTTYVTQVTSTTVISPTSLI